MEIFGEPPPEFFDYTDIPHSEVKPHGFTLTFKVKTVGDLDRCLMKTDTACLDIPEIEFSTAEGTGRYCTIYQFLVETRDKISTISMPRGTPQYEKLMETLEKLQEMISGERPFTIVIQDPFANSFISGDSQKIQCKKWQRTWYHIDTFGLQEYPKYQYTGNEGVKKLLDLVRSSSKIVIFSGAGVSTESGLSAYRGIGEDNIWDKFDPNDEKISNFLADEEVRQRYWHRHVLFYEQLQKAFPNPSHLFSKVLQDQGKLHAVVTQNIDGMYSKCGVFDSNIIELHGTTEFIICLSCSQRLPSSQFHQVLKQSQGKVPPCSHCGGFLKPDTISFGMPLRSEVLALAKQKIEECDLLLVMASSLIVKPVCYLPGDALAKGTPLAIMNIGETDFDKYATVLINEKTGVTSASLIEGLSHSPEAFYPDGACAERIYLFRRLTKEQSR
eukprot:TRINITY_DN15851_c0_g1_i1.p1 TRINITY_DN15851_c0_g1~~TRINITY_DN15851_c0_g1_i1.p1  ORF type:complete len:450 (+),score=48.55 TRINITY_DN15851_c0_g1_i1:23-1351(+)